MDKEMEMSPHKAETYAKLSPTGAKLFKYIEFDDKEELILEIRKHPIGAVVIGATGVIIALVIAVAAAILARNLDNSDIINNSGNFKGVLLAGGLILALLALAISAISVAIYNNNVIYVTNQKIAEVSYLSIFNRKVTQLGLGSVEDVTFRQQGIFARLFSYGTIIVETAGEVENCYFTLLPNPNFYSQKIIRAHEDFVDAHGA